MTRTISLSAPTESWWDEGQTAMSHGEAKPAPSVLVVIGHPERRRLWSDFFLRHGYRVTLASDGEEALKKIGAEDFDLVISGILMRGMDGLELLRLLPGIAPGLPVIVIGAPETKFNETYLRCARLLGAVQTHSRPPNPESLLDYAQMFIREYRASRKR